MMTLTMGIVFSAIFLVSIIFSMLGQGGGALYTPIQVWAGVDFHVAATTSLFLIMVISLSATLVFRKAGRVDWPLALVLESVTASGAFLGGIFSGHFSSAVLSMIFSAVLAFAAFFMILDPGQDQKDRRESSGPLFWKRQFGARVYAVNMPLALGLSFIAGIFSGMLGVGGGILKVPLMVLLLGVPMEIAIGSSAFMVGFTAAGGFLGHVVSGHWDWRMSLILGVAVFAGAQIGARKSLKMDRQKLRKWSGWILFAVALIMAVKAL